MVRRRHGNASAQPTPPPARRTRSSQPDRGQCPPLRRRQRASSRASALDSRDRPNPEGDMTRRTSRARTSRVFLHIGAPVAGSTYLRECLARHRRKLTRYGVLYPPSHLGHDGGHLGAVLDVLDLSGGDHAPTTGAWDRLAESARDWRRGTVVISHELLAGASEEQIDRIVGSFGNAEVHVVYAARDLARQIPLAWQEWVRGGGTATFEGYTNRIVEHGEHRLSQVFWSTHALDDVLARWAAYVPAGRIHLLPLPQDHGRSSVVWDRFAQTIGLNPRKFKVGSDEHAKPLSKVANEVLRLLTAEITDHPTPRGIDRVRSVLEKQPG